MPPALVKALTVASTKTAGTANVNVVVPAGGIAAGNTIIVFVAMDNSAAGTPTITSIARPAGETAAWVTVGNGNTIATLGAGVRTVMMSIKTTVAWPAGNYLVTLSGSTPAKVTAGWEWSGLTGATRQVSVQSNATSGALSLSIFTGGQAIGDVLIAVGAWENNTPGPDDTDTLNGAWQTGLTAATSGGSANTNVALRAQYKILTAATATQTWNSTGTSDASAVIATFIPEPDAPTTPVGGFTGTLAWGAAVASGVAPALPTLYAPIAEYAFDEGSGIAAREPTDVYDIALTGPDPWEAVGHTGSAFRFTTAEIGVGPALPISGEFTIAAWVRTDGITSSLTSFIVEPIGGGFEFSIESRLVGGNMVYIAKGGIEGFYRTSTIGATGWQHVAFSRDAGGVIRMYRNGALTSAGATPIPAADWSQGFRIGRNGAVGEPWFVDELRFYDKAISAYQVGLDMGVAPGAMPPVLPPAAPTGGATGTLAWGPAVAYGTAPRKGGATGTIAWGPAVASGKAVRRGGATGTIAFGPAVAGGKAPRKGGAVGTLSWGPAVTGGVKPVIPIPTGGATGTLSWGPATASGKTARRGGATGTISWGPAVAAGRVVKRGGATGTLSWGPAVVAGKAPRRGGAAGTLSWGPAVVGASAPRKGGASATYSFGPATATGRRISRGGAVAAGYGWGAAVVDGDAPTGGGFGYGDTQYGWGEAVVDGERLSRGGASAAYTYGPSAAGGRTARRGGASAGAYSFGPSVVDGEAQPLGDFEATIEWGPADAAGSALPSGGVEAAYAFGPAETGGGEPLYLCWPLDTVVVTESPLRALVALETSLTLAAIEGDRLLLAEERAVTLAAEAPNLTLVTDGRDLVLTAPERHLILIVEDTC